MLKNKFLKIISTLSSIVVGVNSNSLALNTYFENYYLKVNDQNDKYDLLDPNLIRKNFILDSSGEKLDFAKSENSKFNGHDQQMIKSVDNQLSTLQKSKNSISPLTSDVKEKYIDNLNIDKCEDSKNTLEGHILGASFDLNKHMRGASGNKLISKKSWLDFLFRAKYLNRWHILNSREKETLSDHLFETGVVAHSLALIRNNIFNGTLNPDRAMTLSIFHDILELYTGDMPTTTKYLVPEMKKVYSKVENISKSKFLDLVPSELKGSFKSILDGKDEPEWEVVKEADILVAYIKAVIECSHGNQDYEGPLELLESQLEELSESRPEVKYFLYEVLPSFYSKS